MRKSTDTLSRQWTLLRTVPAHPQWLSTRELHQRSCASGLEVSIRTIQRDLDFLSSPFPLHSETRGKTHYWQWMQGASGLEIPSMSQSTALVFQLTDHYLRGLIPSSVLKLLSPYTERAEQALVNSKLSNWNDKIISLEQGISLTPPEVDEEVRDIVYSALLEGKKIEVEYTRRYTKTPSSYPVSPLGIVLRDGVLYLVCKIMDYSDIRQLAIHRINQAVLLDEEVTTSKEFSLRDYIEKESAFNYPESNDVIKLKIILDQGAAWHLTERKLSEDQKLIETKDGNYCLTASVANTAGLRWWLLGFGDGLEVVLPKSLRKEFKSISKAMAQIYS